MVFHILCICSLNLNWSRQVEVFGSIGEGNTSNYCRIGIRAECFAQDFRFEKVNTEFIKIHKFSGSHRIVAKTMRPSMVQFNVVHIQRGSHKQYEAKFPIQLSVATPISIVNCVLVVDTAIVFDGA